MKRILLICIFIPYLINGQLFDRPVPIDVEKEQKDTKAIVDEAVSFFKKNTLSEVCRAFVEDSYWHRSGSDIFYF